MARGRDDFSPAVRIALAMRVGWRCSLCGRDTTGPHSDAARSVNIGKAAHVAAAAPGGPRFDASMTADERSAPGNGMWMCATCADMIDRDVVRYPAAKLLAMKAEAEAAQGARVRALGLIASEPPIVSISKLPETGGFLFGRERDLRALDDAWQSATVNVLVLHGWGGIGKTTLLRTWVHAMARSGFGDARRVFAWSFYSHGTDRNVSADEFTVEALRWFGDEDPERGGAWGRAERLGQWMRREKTLLVLDGVEPLQFPPGPRAGQLKDVALRTLIIELAAMNPGLCVVTTRLPVASIEGFAGMVEQRELSPLDDAAAREVLEAMAVTVDEDPHDVNAAFGGQPLALTLLGRYLAEAHGGLLSRWRKVSWSEVMDGHAERVMQSYAVWLGEESPELQVLQLVGLFDRPATAAELNALRHPPIPQLSDRLQSEERWNAAIHHLRGVDLLLPPHDAEAAVLDAHPLVRAYFATRTRGIPHAYREAAGRLFDLLRRQPEKRPTPAELVPLYEAVERGVQAARPAEAWRVFHDIIQEGPRRSWLAGVDLMALASFFVEPWTKLVTGLSPRDQASVLNDTGFLLRAAGRMREAIEATTAALQCNLAIGDPVGAATSALNLAQMFLARAEFDAAESFARQSVEHADRSDQDQWSRHSRSVLASILHHRGDYDGAMALFLETERMYRAAKGTRDVLPPLAGTRLCELLLDLGRRRDAFARAKAMMKEEDEKNRHLGRAWCRLILTRATESAWRDGDRTSALRRLRSAEQLCVMSEAPHLLVRVLAARASALRGRENVEARNTIERALRIARSMGLELYETDALMELAGVIAADDDIAGALDVVNTIAARPLDRISVPQRRELAKMRVRLANLLDSVRS